MTEPTQAAIEAARERLAKAVEEYTPRDVNYPAAFRSGKFDGEYDIQALAIALQEMSDAVKEAGNSRYLSRDAKDAIATALAPFILPNSVVDPLVEAMSEAMCGVPGEDYAKPAADLREELAKRGLQIVPVHS